MTRLILLGIRHRLAGPQRPATDTIAPHDKVPSTFAVSLQIEFAELFPFQKGRRVEGLPMSVVARRHAKPFVQPFPIRRGRHHQIPSHKRKCSGVAGLHRHGVIEAGVAPGANPKRARLSKRLLIWARFMVDLRSAPTKALSYPE